MPSQRIRFEELEHAYGKADDVPDLLAAVGGTDAKAAKRALRTLADALLHQHSVYSASAAAVEPLLALAMRPNGLLRAEILDLLAGIMLGDPDAEIDGGRDMSRPEVRARFADEVSSPYLAAYQTLISRAHEVLALARDKDAKVRIHAAFILGFLADGAAARLLAVLEVLHKERSAAPRASLAIACGLLARYAASDAAAAPLRALATGKTPELVALAATLGWVWSDEANAPTAALDRLEHFAQQPPKTPTGFAWGDLGRLAENVLFRVRPPAVEPLLKDLARVATKDSMDPAWKRAQMLSGKLQKLLFGTARREEDPWIGAELGEQQRSYLRLVAEHELGGSNPDFFGLPRQAKTLRRLIGDTVGALDAEISVTVAGEQRRWPIWRALRAVLDHAVPRGAILAAVARQTSPEQRRAAADELASKSDHWELRLPRARWGLLPTAEGNARRKQLDDDVAALVAALRV